MLEFQQNEQTAARRRWILVLVDATDGVTGLTGQTGQVYVSKNGGTPALSTNSIAEVSAANMPGHYYIELTAAELNTLGFISISKKTAGSLAFHDRGLVSYNDPYVMAGGFSGGGEAGPLKLTAQHLDMIAKRVWDYQLEKESTGKLLERAADHPDLDLSSVQKQIDGIKMPELDLSPVLSAIDKIEMPKPFNYTSMFEELNGRLESIENAQVTGLQEAIADFTKRMDLATADINTSLDTVKSIKEGFGELKTLVDKFNESIAAATDMDKRFENMTAVMQQKELAQLSAAMTNTMAKILTEVTNAKYDIIQELKQQ